MPLLLTLDPDKKYDCCFMYDAEKQAWQVRFEERAVKDINEESEDKRKGKQASESRQGSQKKEEGEDA